MFLFQIFMVFLLAIRFSLYSLTIFIRLFILIFAERPSGHKRQSGYGLPQEPAQAHGRRGAGAGLRRRAVRDRARATREEPAGAAAVITGDAVDPHADQFGDIEAGLDIGHQFARRQPAWLQVAVARRR